MNLNLHIERIILEGVTIEPHEQAIVKASVISELGNLLTNTELPSYVTSHNLSPVIYGSEVSLSVTSAPRDLGMHVARSIYEGINK